MTGGSDVNRPIQDLAKRLIDVAGAGVGLIVLSPVILALALAVRLGSRGPAFFKQTRVGRDGREFTLVKFRSMENEGDEASHREYMQGLVDGTAASRPNHEGDPVYLLDDPRVNPVGHFLRRTSLDELPNLINVLKGDMSLVGPRPPIPYEVELYDERARRRLAVKPGMTGLAQVRGRGSLTFDEIIAHDLEYIERRSIALDLRILLETIPAVLTRRGV